MKHREHKIRVEPDEHGRRLDAVLVGRYPRLNRAAWQDRIREGHVLIGAHQPRAGRKMKHGEEILFRFEAGPEPDVDESYSILFEDGDLLVINKPGDLPVHPSGTYNENTLYGLLRRDRGLDFVAHFAHRLDRETSGVLVLGKHPKSARLLGRAFLEGAVRKEYLAVVEGCPQPYLDARGFLSRDPGSQVFRKRQFVPGEEQPASAQAAPPPGNRLARDRPVFCRTEFRNLQSRVLRESGDVLSLVYARLHTGRLHQIRATLCSLGFPLVGDRLYGVDDSMYLRLINDAETDEDRRRLRISRSALHCRRIVLAHPGTGQRISFRAPLPAEIGALVFGGPADPQG